MKYLKLLLYLVLLGFIIYLFIPKNNWQKELDKMPVAPLIQERPVEGHDKG